jgi:hypothetical protein
LEGGGSSLIEALSRHLPGGTEGDHDKPVRIACVPAEIRNYCLRSTGLEIYRSARRLGLFGVTLRVDTDAIYIISAEINQD